MISGSKTATLYAIVLANVTLERSIFICSHKNMAVDSLLRLLISRWFKDFLRFGRTLNVVDKFTHPLYRTLLHSNADEECSQLFIT